MFHTKDTKDTEEMTVSGSDLCFHFALRALCVNHFEIY